MIAVTSVEAQSRFGGLIDRVQREPIEITRRGRTVASEHDMKDLSDLHKRSEDAARWYSHYRQQVSAEAAICALTDSDIVPHRLPGLFDTASPLAVKSGRMAPENVPR